MVCLCITGNGKAITFGAALMMCVVPYIVPDAAKLALAAIISGKLKRFVKV